MPTCADTLLTFQRLQHVHSIYFFICLRPDSHWILCEHQRESHKTTMVVYDSFARSRHPRQPKIDMQDQLQFYDLLKIPGSKPMVCELNSYQTEYSHFVTELQLHLSWDPRR